MKPIARVLLVEDSEDDACLVLAALKHSGVEVDHQRVWTRETLAAALQQGPWHAVLSDHNMPQFDGIEALAMVRAHDQDIPFILVSGAIGEETAVAALLRNAELAMYRAKDQGKNNFQFHSPQMNARSFENVVIERFLRRAIELDEFLLHYQPQVEVATGRVVGAEALLRWNHPGLGMMSPVKFIPLAEETGLIVPIGRIVLMRACVEAKCWQDAGAHDFRIAVNLSPRQFSHDDLVSDVRHILEDTGLPPETLELEITESMVMDKPEQATTTLHELRALGVKLAIDDFGTGYSSLGYLKRFPVNTLKVDRSFIKDIPHDADDVAITNAVIAMGRSLRLSVVAEGVETTAQADFLRSNGCDLMQGFLIGKPMPAAELRCFLEKNGLIAATIPISAADCLSN